MIVTRAVSDGSLNTDVSTQFLAQPQAIIIGGAIVGGLVVVPGTPKIPLILTSSLLLTLGLNVSKKMKTFIENEEESLEQGIIEDVASEEDYYKDINNIYPLLNVEPIEMEFGYSLIPLVDENSGGKLINRIVIFRRQYAQDMGIVIPSIRLRDSASLNPNQYTIKIKGEIIATGEILIDHYLALEPPNPSGTIDGIETIEPAYGIPSKWILPQNKELAEIYGYTVIDPLSVMVTHMSEIVSKHSYELLSRAEIMQLIENVRAYSPEIIEEAFPNIITYGNFQKILSNLLKEGVPIKDLVTIIETIVDSSSTSRDLDTITENVRVALKRTITRKFCEGGQIKVITLDAELEKTIITSMSKSEHGIYISLSPDILQKVLTQLTDNITKFNEIHHKPVILTSHVIRIYFYRLIEQFYPNISVISFNEIANNVQIQSIGNIVI